MAIPEEIQNVLEEIRGYTYIDPCDIENFKKDDRITVDGYMTLDELEKLVALLKKMETINEIRNQ